MTKLFTPFSIVKIRNIKVIRWTKLKKMANNWMDHSKRPTRRTEKILKNDTEIFLTCGFRGVLKKRLLYHNIELSENSLGRFSVKIRPKSKKAHFWHVFVIFEWSGIFSENRAVPVSSHYRYVSSCKKAKKSLEPFPRCQLDQQTNRPTDQQTDQRDWFHRTSPPKAEVQNAIYRPKNPNKHLWYYELTSFDIL